jgi:hypothetical protein
MCIWSHTHFDQEELWQLAIFLIPSGCFLTHERERIYSSARHVGGGMSLPQVGVGLAREEER